MASTTHEPRSTASLSATAPPPFPPGRAIATNTTCVRALVCASTNTTLSATVLTTAAISRTKRTAVSTCTELFRPFFPRFASFSRHFVEFCRDMMLKRVRLMKNQRPFAFFVRLIPSFSSELAFPKQRTRFL